MRHCRVSLLTCQGETSLYRLVWLRYAGRVISKLRNCGKGKGTRAS